MTAAPEAPWKRLSPRMLLVHPLQELARMAPALVAALIAGSAAGGHGDIWTLAAAALTVALALLRWFTTTYRISPELLELRKGLVKRQISSVPTDRVRAVDLTAHVAHRVLGLTRVTVSTGHSAKAEHEGLRFDALTRAEAELLRDQLVDALRLRTTDAGDVGEDGSGQGELARMRPGWIRFAPFSLSGFVLLGALAVVLEESGFSPSSFGPVDRLVHGLRGAYGPEGVAWGLLAVLAAGLLVNVAQYAVKHGDFRLTRQESGTLETSHGLFTVRTVTLEERRIRGVELRESLPLRLLGGAGCVAIATGMRSPRTHVHLVPSGPRGEVVRAADAVLRDPGPLSATLTGHGPAARRRRFNRTLVPAVLTFVVLGAGWARDEVPFGVWCASLLLLPAAALLARDRYTGLGHALSGSYLVVGRGSLARSRAALSCDGIIGWNLRRSPFQRRSKLLTLTATTAGGLRKYVVQDIGDQEALRLVQGATPGMLAPFLETAGRRPGRTETAGACR